MLTWLKSLFSGPTPAGPPQVLRAFAADTPTIAQSGIRAEQGAWRIDVTGKQTIRLFEVDGPEVEQCLLTYRAELKAESLQGSAYLEMWCRFPGRGDFFSKGYQQAVSGTVNWARYEIPFYLKRGQQPDLVKLNLAVEGSGTVWLRNVELLRTPLVSQDTRARACRLTSACRWRTLH